MVRQKMQPEPALLPCYSFGLTALHLAVGLDLAHLFFSERCEVAQVRLPALLASEPKAGPTLM